ncbi:GTPase domain-containing protein [Methylomonas methanica]|uniref:GTP-binding protein HSR1-related protein n=1 Tax=Methylomonas methanica (strain DSM 25384 / MC09) TaxID=857087 RepID=F9ZV70_METMM|nr:GTPase domain-containing protein [Methylomonas methanica]AEG00680.1 GTP-binding protein HSR1-related protein [Methylomonas methanica MC09]
MLEFIQLLKQRYQSVLAQLDLKSPLYFEYQQRIEQLLYAEAFLRKGVLIHDFPKCPLQVAVIGPTQAGKSSIVNVLLNDALAGVSPLAGYTVHAQGFCHGLTSDALDGLQHYFGRFQCLDAASLSRNRLDCYSVSHCSTQSALLPACVIWDTPDFDSIDAVDYREGVIRTLALADLIVLVVSKEKYADQSVWEVMQTLEAFGQPTLICLNKLAEGSETLVLDSLRQKWQQTRGDAMPKVVSLLFEKPQTVPVWPLSAETALLDLAKQLDQKKHSEQQQLFLNKYWRQWLEPVFAEHRAQNQWQGLIDQCLEEAGSIYRRDFLDHPHHYHTFQAALLNLLKLLEIPGIAKFLSKTRRMMTWPVRKLMSLGQSDFNAGPDQEISILNQIGDHVMIRLADKLLEKTETEPVNSGWWRETAILLRQKRGELSLTYQQAVVVYHQDFLQDIDAAAHRLYYKLEEQPLVLNSLRATRISTDAGGMFLAIQAGGIGVHDLVITPLMLTITSLLAESAIGGYMQRVEADLKQQQMQTVKTRLFQTVLREQLYQIPQHIQLPTRFNITEQQCLQAEQALKEKKHGLRIL